MARTTWYQWAVSAVPEPWRKKWGRLYAQAQGLLVDAYEEATKQAALVRLPERAPPDAQVVIGEERGIERADGETQAEYGAALAGAWETWQTSGTDEGLEAILRRLCWSTAIVLEASEISGYPPEKWARFAVIFPYQVGEVWSDHDWDDPGDWSDGGVWDSSWAQPKCDRVARTIERFRPAENKLTVALVQTNPDAELWDWPTGIWDDPGVWASDTDTGFVRVA